MKMTIPMGGHPKVPVVKKGRTLFNILANLYILQRKAKLAHWNTTGPSFYGDHKTYDMVYNSSINWQDVLGERIRALRESVNFTGKSIDSEAMFGEVDSSTNPKKIKEDMIASLECLTHCMMEMINGGELDEPSSNILQEICVDLDQKAYFLRSSL